MRVVVGATVAAWKANNDSELAWLNEWERYHEWIGDDVELDAFCALEVGSPHDARFARLRQRLDNIGATVWEFSLNDGEKIINGGNRLRRITTGRNLICDYATMTGAHWVQFLDTDVHPPSDIIANLLELDHPFCAAQIPAYCLGGPDVSGYPADWEVQQYQESAGTWLVARDVFERIRWRTDLDLGLTDDPAYHRDVHEYLGIDMYVRRDTKCVHVEWLEPVETRRSVDDRRLV